MKYAIIDTAARAVINTIDYDTAPSNPPPGFPAGTIAVRSDLADMSWTWDGSVLVAPPIPAPPPITSVTPRQARLALLQAGLLDQAEAAVTAAGGATKITWDYATEINRADPLITSISAALSLTPAQIDILFKYAASQ